MTRLLIGLVVSGLLAGSAWAEPLACEDVLRTHRVLIETYVSGRARYEVEAAQAIAALTKRIEQLINERDAARAKLKEQGK